MRHNKKNNHLSRKAGHRHALMSNMANSLILHKRISTTTAKAKELRKYVEPLLTKSKEDNTHNRRVVFGYLKNKYAVAELFREVSPKITDRQGGYTRILKTGSRLGDNAEMCIIELVDYNENLLTEKKESKTKKSTRRRRGGGKAKTENAEASNETSESDEVKPAETEANAGQTVEKSEIKVEEPKHNSSDNADVIEEKKTEDTKKSKTDNSVVDETGNKQEKKSDSSEDKKEEK